MYIIKNNTYRYAAVTVTQYGGKCSEILSPYVQELFSSEKNEYAKLIIELNTASQHLLIEIDRMSHLNRKLTTEEHADLMRLYDHQIAAQATLQRHLHRIYDGTDYVG